MSITQPICQPICRPIVSKLTDYVGGLGYVPIINDAGQLAPFVTFTRSSTATYFDSNGVLQTAAANQPRYDHDPVTKVLRGLLIEEQRTNVLLNSDTLATQSVTVTASARTLSFYGTGTVTLSGAATGTLVGTGANNRVSLTFTPAAGTLTLTVSGSVTKAQLEAGAFATSYIPTTTAAITRAQDVAEISTVSSIGFNVSEGTVFFDGITSPRTTAAAAEPLWSFAPTLYCARGASTQALGAFIGTAAFSATTFTSASSAFKSAVGFAANNGALSVNAESIITRNDTVVPSVTNIRIGSRGTETFNGHIRRLRYYNRRLSNAQLQALTA